MSEAPANQSGPAATPPPAKPPAPPPAGKRFSQWAWEWIKSIVVALAIWFVIRALLIEAFRIPSSSMERTLLVGDFLFVNKALYGAEVPLVGTRLPAVREPVLGDIVVFDSKMQEGVKVVKRVVGMPGDTLEMRDTQLFRNGGRAAEPFAVWTTAGSDPLDQLALMKSWQVDYLLPSMDRTVYRPDRRSWGPVVVPEGQYFVMGDNRDNSWDSRYWGFVDRRMIRGRPLFIYYSFDHDSWRALPFVTAIRWGRLFSQPN